MYKRQVFTLAAPWTVKEADALSINYDAVVSAVSQPVTGQAIMSVVFVDVYKRQDQDSTFDFLSSLFLSFIFIKLVRYADQNCPGGCLPVPVHVLGEELCACGVIPDLSRKISVIRSRNISMSCVFQNLAGLQNRYPNNQWQEILGNCDVQLFLGCTDALTAEFISSRSGEASVAVTSQAKQLGTWRISNYTPEYRETSGVGRRRLLTMDEVLRLDVDKALVIIRGRNILEVDKFDYSKHYEEIGRAHV